MTGQLRVALSRATQSARRVPQLSHQRYFATQSTPPPALKSTSTAGTTTTTTTATANQQGAAKLDSKSSGSGSSGAGAGTLLLALAAGAGGGAYYLDLIPGFQGDEVVSPSGAGKSTKHSSKQVPFPPPRELPTSAVDEGKSRTISSKSSPSDSLRSVSAPSSSALVDPIPAPIKDTTTTTTTTTTTAATTPTSTTTTTTSVGEKKSDTTTSTPSKSAATAGTLTEGDGKAKKSPSTLEQAGKKEKKEEKKKEKKKDKSNGSSSSSKESKGKQEKEEKKKKKTKKKSEPSSGEATTTTTTTTSAATSAATTAAAATTTATAAAAKSTSTASTNTPVQTAETPAQETTTSSTSNPSDHEGAPMITRIEDAPLIGNTPTKLTKESVDNVLTELTLRYENELARLQYLHQIEMDDYRRAIVEEESKRIYGLFAQDALDRIEVMEHFRESMLYLHQKIESNIDFLSVSSHSARVSTGLYGLEKALAQRTPFKAELAAMRKESSGDPVILAALHSISPDVAQRGIATVDELRTRFPQVRAAAEQAGIVKDTSSLFQHTVARIFHALRWQEQAGDVGPTRQDTDARLARAALYLERGGLYEVLEELEHVEGNANVVVESFRKDVADRLSMQQAVDIINTYKVLLDMRLV